MDSGLTSMSSLPAASVTIHHRFIKSQYPLDGPKDVTITGKAVLYHTPARRLRGTIEGPEEAQPPFVLHGTLGPVHAKGESDLSSPLEASVVVMLLGVAAIIVVWEAVFKRMLFHCKS